MTDTPDIAALVARLAQYAKDWADRAGDVKPVLDAKAALERLARERDHYLSNWQEARQYLAIETQHAEQAEAERDALKAENERLTKMLESIAEFTSPLHEAGQIARAALQSTGEKP